MALGRISIKLMWIEALYRFHWMVGQLGWKFWCVTGPGWTHQNKSSAEGVTDHTRCRSDWNGTVTLSNSLMATPPTLGYSIEEDQILIVLPRLGSTWLWLGSNRLCHFGTSQAEPSRSQSMQSWLEALIGRCPGLLHHYWTESLWI